ncbi:MAG: hypothetical protein FJX76_10405 [Armatimonadetes bacterium]|nr:hypothetical protein [Armatimonadota bacterium]
MKVYSYIVVSDSGFAPNPFHGVCTLACCKPMIRKGASVGDIIVGMTSRGERIVYAMKVSKVLDFADYWTGVQYTTKRPKMDTGRALDRCGDNIYEPVAFGEFRQWASFHSNKDGTENIEHLRHDLDGEKVLLAQRFAYFGQSGPLVPCPILSDNVMLSLPIPDKSSPIRYQDVTLGGYSLGPVVSDLTRGKKKPHFGAHLDPDLVMSAYPRGPGWRAIFGQADREQTVLAREGVGIGDLFLFFGWFRRAEFIGDLLQFVKGAPDLHALCLGLDADRGSSRCGDGHDPALGELSPACRRGGSSGEQHALHRSRNIECPRGCQRHSRGWGVPSL